MVNPTQYTSFNNLQKNGIQRVINQFSRKLMNMSGKCMDIGCGSGDVTSDILLSALDPNAVIIGTDISEDMIEHARKIYADKKRLEFEVLDIQTKNLPEKYISKFDHIFSFYALHWCTNMRQTFENIYRMLRPGGTIFILFVASHDAVFKVLETMAQDVRFAAYMQNTKKYILPFNGSIRPQEELKNLLENIKFHVYHCNHQEYNIFDSENFLLSLMSIFTFLDEMPSDQKEEFKINFVRNYMDKKIELYGSKQDDVTGITVLDKHKLFLVYAQKK